MATEVPVERRKKGLPWWGWLLLALVVIGLIWLLFALFNDNDEAGSTASDSTATATSEEDPPRPESPLTDLQPLIDSEDPTSFAGFEVQLEDALVQSVVGDKTFWIGPSPDQTVFVFLEEEIDPAGVEGLVNVNPGQQVAITGTIVEMPPMEQALSEFEVSQENSSNLEGEQVYIRATQTEIATK